MIQKEFALQAAKVLSDDDHVIGLAVGGSWLTDELDEFSDLDLVLVTEQNVSGNRAEMLRYAEQLGELLTGFTGEHVGEPRVLICLYDNPLLHVDIKFLTLDELNNRVENPHLLFDRDDRIKQVLDSTKATFPLPDYQWIEDRFWIWVHYALLKTGRGEYMEAVDFFGFLRMVVLGPLLHIKNGNLPRAVRKVETTLKPDDFERLRSTVPQYERQAILNALKQAVHLYRELRSDLYGNEIVLREATESKVMHYFTGIESRQSP